MANGKGPGSKHKRVKSNYLKGKPTDAKRQSFDHPRDTKEYNRKKKLKNKLAELNKKKDEKVLAGKKTKGIDRKIKRKKKQIAGKTFLQKLKRWDGTWK